MIADPDAAVRQYVPKSADVLCYTDIVAPERAATIYFRAPTEKGAIRTCAAFPATGW